MTPPGVPGAARPATTRLLFLVVAFAAFVSAATFLLFRRGREQVSGRVQATATVSGHVHVRCQGPRGALAADVEFVRCAL